MGSGIKEQVETTMGNVFSDQSLREKGLRFKPTRDIPNSETLEAMEEARRILAHPGNYKGMTVDEAFREMEGLPRVL